MSDSTTYPSAPQILTPDQRLRVFVSSTLQELSDERSAAKSAILNLRLTPILFELGARPHPPRELYRAYLEQSHIFVGIYWQRYGWVAPDMDISGLEDEYRLASGKPKLIYLKHPAPQIEPRLKELLAQVQADNTVSYKPFSTPAELADLIQNDLALLLTEQFQLRQAAQVPAQPAAAARPDNLPVAATPLVGREAELEAVSQMLQRPEVRLVTLHGPGGIGKTRLAIEIARRLRETFPDGVCFVPLVNISDPRLVIPAIAREAGLTETGLVPLEATLEEYLRSRNFLLILDNFEQVTEAADLLSALLKQAAQLKILVTSRAVLRLSGEHQYAIPPLRLPDSRQVRAMQAGDFSQLSNFSALTLFLQSAQRIKSNFALTPENIADVAEICRGLDGLPLAIELAAARIKLFTPQAMRARLESSLDWLTSGARDHPTHQQTLRSAIEWSFSLLAEEERGLFLFLSVFLGGATLEAIRAVRSDQDEMALLDYLASLVDKSLIRQEEEPDGEPRFAMLQTIREFALDLLHVEPESQDIHQRHADYFLALVEKAGPEMKGPKQQAWFPRIEQEYGNIRTAVRWYLQQGAFDRVARINWSLWYFWWNHGHHREATHWAEAVLAKEASLPLELRGRAFYIVGFLNYVQGNYQATMPLRDRLLTLTQQAGDKPAEALAYAAFGLVYTHLSRPQDAQDSLEKSLQLYSELGDKWGIAFVTTSLGQVSVSMGDRELAILQLADGVARYWEAGDKTAIVFSQYFLGMTLLMQNDVEWGSSLLLSGLSLAAEVNQMYYFASCLEGVASVASVRGQAERAARLWGAAQAVREATGNRSSPTEQGLYDPLMAPARAQLQGAAFQELCEAGKAMTVREAIAYANDASG